MVAQDEVERAAAGAHGHPLAARVIILCDRLRVHGHTHIIPGQPAGELPEVMRLHEESVPSNL